MPTTPPVRQIGAEDPVLAHRHDGILALTLNRPARRNAMDEAAWALLHDVASTLTELPKPVVAKVDGVAVGAGWNLDFGPAGQAVGPAGRLHRRRGSASGLVTWVTQPEQIGGFVDEIARRLAKAPPVAIAQAKALLHEGADQTLRQALETSPRPKW